MADRPGLDRRRVTSLPSGFTLDVRRAALAVTGPQVDFLRTVRKGDGVLVALFPAADALSVVSLLGVYALAFGALFIALGIRLRHAARVGRQQPSPA